MIIHAFPSGPFATNAYVIVCPDTKQMAIVDPAPDSARTIIDFISTHAVHPEKILLTHSHWDHIAETALLKEHYKLPVYIHADDKGNLEKPGSDRIRSLVQIPGVQPDHLLKEGENISVGNLEFEVIHTPGHTPGGVCFYCKKHHLLISGDTLFKGTMGNVSLPTARPSLMWHSLKKLSLLPSETIVYPGHGASTTIGEETWLENAQKTFE